MSVGYPIPGDLISCILQKPTETRDSGGGVPRTWAAEKTFNGGIEQLTARERALFNKETTESTHKLYVSFDQIGSDSAPEMKEKNRIYLPNTSLPIAAETFDITGVNVFRNWNDTIGHWELDLKKVE